jgi:hypothetical protein
VPIFNQESGWSCICLFGGINFTSFHDFLIRLFVFITLILFLFRDLHGNKLEKLTAESFVDLEKLVEFRLHSQNPRMSIILFDSNKNKQSNQKIMERGKIDTPQQTYT